MILFVFTENILPNFISVTLTIENLHDRTPFFTKYYLKNAQELLTSQLFSDAHRLHNIWIIHNLYNKCLH